MSAVPTANAVTSSVAVPTAATTPGSRRTATAQPQPTTLASGLPPAILKSLTTPSEMDDFRRQAEEKYVAARNLISQGLSNHSLVGQTTQASGASSAIFNPPVPTSTTTSQQPLVASPPATPGSSVPDRSFYRPLTPPPPPAHNAGSKKRRPNGQIDPAAVDVLIQIPGIKKHSIRSMLYVARRVTPSDPMYDQILTYINNSQQHYYGIEVLSIIRIIRDEDNIEFDKDPNTSDQFRMMLWHGTTVNAVAPILKYGFKTPADVGQMFGAGIYFADRASKSCNYCTNPTQIPQPAGSTGFLFLCDVLLGNTYSAKKSNNSLTAPPTATSITGQPLHFDSVKCIGSYIPDASGNVFCKGSLMPIGKTITNTKFTTYSVVHNEYVVYSPEKVKPKYLVKVKFHATYVTN